MAGYIVSASPALLLLLLCLLVSSLREVVATPRTGGDPHMIGARGTSFDFNGELGQSYCLLVDKSLVLNVLLDGYPTPDSPKGLRSWIKELGLIWKDFSGKEHKLVLTARKGKDAGRGSEGFLSSVSLDGHSKAAPKLAGDVLVGPGELKLQMLRVSTQEGMEQEHFLLEIGDMAQLGITLNPENSMLRTAQDAHVHFNVQTYKLQVTPGIHGILGQTYQAGLERVARAAEYQMLVKLHGEPVQADDASGAGFLDGTPADYKTSGIAMPDCVVAKAWASA